MDATSYIRFESGGLGYDTEIQEGNILMRDINSEIKERYPNVLTIAEDLKGHDLVTKKSGMGWYWIWVPMGYEICTPGSENFDYTKVTNIVI